MNLFSKQNCDVVLFRERSSAAHALLLMNICLSNGFICKYLITSTLRLGSSVGRAED